MAKPAIGISVAPPTSSTANQTSARPARAVLERPEDVAEGLTLFFALFLATMSGVVSLAGICVNPRKQQFSRLPRSTPLVW
jgi:hypothetical protein